jgi:hypothetical protein
LCAFDFEERIVWDYYITNSHRKKPDCEERQNAIEPNQLSRVSLHDFRKPDLQGRLGDIGGVSLFGVRPHESENLAWLPRWIKKPIALIFSVIGFRKVFGARIHGGRMVTPKDL